MQQKNNLAPSVTKEDIKNNAKEHVKKKYWRIHSKEGKQLEFLPIFEVNEKGEAEARFLEFRFTDPVSGKEETMHFNWLDIYMFIYFTCNEELRRNLALRYERQVNYIPYDVTVKITPEEMKTGIAKRRVELPVDELTMAIARNEAMKLMMKNKMKDPRSFPVGGKPRT